MNHNFKKNFNFLKITTGVLVVTLAVGLSNGYFNSIKSNPNNCAFAGNVMSFNWLGYNLSGDCGEFGHESEVKWALTKNKSSDTYTLTISGQGKMKNYFFPIKDLKYSVSPWSRYKDKITKVVVEDGVTYIGKFAFFNYKALIEVEMSSVETIGLRAFEGCSSLQFVEMPLVQTIGDMAFQRCESLYKIELPKAQTIGNMAFDGCIPLQEVKLPKAQTIGDMAFSGCYALQEVKLPKAQIIGLGAFYDCISLKAVELQEAQLVSSGSFARTNINKVIISPEVSISPTAIGYWDEVHFFDPQGNKIDFNFKSDNSDELDNLDETESSSESDFDDQNIDLNGDDTTSDDSDND